MTIYYNAQDRKPLVKAISEFTGADAVYMRTPTYAYRIDYFTVTREGNLEFDDRADSEEIENLLEFLAERGFIAEVADTSATEQPETASEEVSADTDSAEHGESVGLLDYRIFLPYLQRQGKKFTVQILGAYYSNAVFKCRYS